MLDGPDDAAQDGGARDWRDRPAFTASHRAQAICTREVQHLSDEVTRALKAREKAGELASLTVAQSPGRVMVQAGPVALTIAWLRGSADAVADGQLMVIVWEGAVVQGMRGAPERAPGRAVASAKVLLEETFAVVAEDEASWRWRSASDGGTDRTTSELAALCVERLLEAGLARRTA